MPDGGRTGEKSWGMLGEEGWGGAAEPFPPAHPRQVRGSVATPGVAPLAARIAAVEHVTERG